MNDSDRVRRFSDHTKRRQWWIRLEASSPVSGDHRGLVLYLGPYPHLMDADDAFPDHLPPSPPPVIARIKCLIGG